MSEKNKTVVTPFDWQNYTAARRPQARANRARPQAARAAASLSVEERMRRILAQRWGNPYCKPGAA